MLPSYIASDQCFEISSHAIGEFVMMWGDVKTYIGDPLHEMADAAIRREQEIVDHLNEMSDAANTPRTSSRNKEAELHKAELWFIISCLADSLQNGLDAAKPCAPLRQLPWHPAAGILWSDTRLNRCDTVCAQRKRQREAERIFWRKSYEPGCPSGK